jgi:hypothetical protein
VLRDRLARAGRAFAERTFDVWRNGERLARLLGGNGCEAAVAEAGAEAAEAAEGLGRQPWSATSH